MTGAIQGAGSGNTQNVVSSEPGKANESDVARFESSLSPKQTEQYESMKADMSKYLNQYLKEGSKFSDSELQTIYKNLESFTSGFGGPSQKMLEKMMREIENSKHTSTFSKDDLMSNISDSAKAAKSINDGFTNFTVNQIVKNIQENKLTDDSD